MMIMMKFTKSALQNIRGPTKRHQISTGSELVEEKGHMSNGEGKGTQMIDPIASIFYLSFFGGVVSCYQYVSVSFCCDVCLLGS